MKTCDPPKWALEVLSWFCREDLLEEIEGDLAEVYREDRGRMSAFKANMLYSLRVFSFFKFSNVQFIKSGTHMMLFKNYILIAKRNLLKQKRYSLFNLFGLTIGLTASLLMILYVQYELSYDKNIPNADRIHRVGIQVNMENSEMTAAISTVSMGHTMKNEFPEVEDYATFTHFNRLTITIDEEKFSNPNSRIVTQNFLNVFDYPLLLGSKEEVFKEPNSLVISESMAMSYFGKQDILGTVVEVENRGKYTVTGVMKDLPYNVHFRLELLFYAGNDWFTRDEWTDMSYYTYILLKEGVDVSSVDEKLPDFFSLHLEEPVRENFSGTGSLFLQKLTDIHLHSNISYELGTNGNYQYVLIMLSLAIFIVLVVCINYMNMTTAQATKRVKEVGIRKVLGSNRKMLVFQFFTESALLTLASSLLAFPLVTVLLPYFNFLADKSFELSQLLEAHILLTFLLIVLATGIIGGSYPAIFLSKFKAGEVLRKNYSLGGFKMPISKVLNAFQFSVALVMVVVTLTVQRQIEYAKNRDKGFDGNNILKVDLKNRMGPDRTKTLRNELLSNPNITHVAASMKAPGDDILSDGLHFESPDGSMASLKTEFNAVNSTYVPTLGLEIVAGRNFGDQATDRWGYSVIVNETLVADLGYASPQEILGKNVSLPLGLDSDSKIVGVMKDSHMRSLHHKITPHILVNFEPITSLLLIKTDATSMSEMLGSVDDTLAEMTNSSSHEISFLDEAYWKQYQADERQSEIMSIFSSLIVLLALMGLTGLVSFFIRFKAKEINIRKILGAEFNHVLKIYVRQYFVQILLAVIVALPLAHYLTSAWLENFAYPIALPYDLMFVSGIALFVLIFFIVFIQCKMSYEVNPVKYLKKE